MSYTLVKVLITVLALGASLLIAGCESRPSISETVRQKFAPTFKTHVVQVEQRQAYDAAKAALGKFGFRFMSGGPAQGKIEALSAVDASDALQRARQVSLSVRLSPASSGGTEVEALFSEILEDSFSKREGMGTTQPLKDTPLYEVFFRHLDEEVVKAAAK